MEDKAGVILFDEDLFPFFLHGLKEVSEEERYPFKKPDDDALVYVAGVLAEKSKEGIDTIPYSYDLLHELSNYEPNFVVQNRYAEAQKKEIKDMDFAILSKIYGDNTLFILGFLKEFCERPYRPLDQRDFFKTGAVAYNLVSLHFKEMEELYRELSDNFSAYVFLIRYLKERLPEIERTIKPNNEIVLPSDSDDKDIEDNNQQGVLLN